MASTLTGQRLKANVRQKMYFHDPADATVATAVPSTWRSLAGIRSILAGVLVATAHAMVTLKILVGTDSAGTGSTVVVEHATPTTADAQGDVLYLEALIEQIKDVLPGATHYAVELDMNNSAATAVLSVVEQLDRGYQNLTADQIA
jgi:hypothetical protein